MAEWPHDYNKFVCMAAIAPLSAVTGALRRHFLRKVRNPECISSKTKKTRPHRGFSRAFWRFIFLDFSPNKSLTLG
jgi:hypothetical protein